MKTILVDAWNTFVTEGGVNIEMYNLLEQFPNQKIIVTNATAEQCEELGIVEMPYDVFSLEHNPRKTNPEYFIRLLEIYNLRPEDVIYFEHNPEAVESAESLGILAHWYQQGEAALELLHQFLDENV